MGLGPYPDVSLAEARELAAKARKKLLRGIDPLGDQDRDRESITRTHRGRPRLGNGTRLPARRQPGPLARASR
jgi:Arm DNA-binding domain